MAKTQERTGEVHDFRARFGVKECFILAPEGAPAWAYDRQRLWNEVDRFPGPANGRLATEFELGLPKELSAKERKQLLKDFLAPIIAKYGVAADVFIHGPGKGGDYRNHHAHVVLTHRVLGPDGFGEIANTLRAMQDAKENSVWMHAEGGAHALTMDQVDSAHESYQNWKERQEEKGRDAFGFETYVDYVQKRQKEQFEHLTARVAQMPPPAREELQDPVLPAYAKQGDLIAVNPRGQVYTLSTRVTGKDRAELAQYLNPIDRASLFSVSEAQAVMRDVRGWR
jgi:hypothetical protein